MNNNFKHLAAERYSCRDYSQEPIDKQQILDILECARLAPSACNRQPWKFIVVTDSNELSAVCESYDRNWIKEAPAAIIVLGNRNEAWHRQYDNYDAINVNKTSDIPCDYDGVMGVPITFLDKYSPEQFEII